MDSPYLTLLILISIPLLIWAIRRIIKGVKYPKLERDNYAKTNEIVENQKKIKQLEIIKENLQLCIEQKDKVFAVYKEKNVDEFAGMYADMATLQFAITSDSLRNVGRDVSYKKGRSWHQTIVKAPIAADAIDQFKKETEKHLKQYKVMLYKYESLLEAFPDIEKYVDGMVALKKIDNFSDTELKSKYDTLTNTIKDKENNLYWRAHNLDIKEKDIRKIVTDSELGKTKYLSEMIADYYSVIDKSIVDDLLSKPRPITINKGQEFEKIINGDLRHLRIAKKEFDYFYNEAISAYPELKEFSPYELLVEEKEIEDTYYNITEQEYKKLSKEEYEKLEPREKNQKRLDMWWIRRKSKWGIGRDYERYIGWLYEKEGFYVKYQGINEGKEDRGIDLICENKNQISLVQCKYWKESVEIRENTVNQLYGTSTKFMKDKTKGTLFESYCKPIKMVIFTSSTLSETAKEFAKTLDVIVKEKRKLERYPIIKCNISITGEKIYHLPFDQQYDNTKIENKGEFYAMTIQEAEEAGFRRAWRWFGDK